MTAVISRMGLVKEAGEEENSGGKRGAKQGGEEVEEGGGGQQEDEILMSQGNRGSIVGKNMLHMLQEIGMTKNGRTGMTGTIIGQVK